MFLQYSIFELLLYLFLISFGACASATTLDKYVAQNDDFDLSANNSDCPTWHELENGTCLCGSTYGGRLKCLPNKRVSIEVGNCMTYISNQTLTGACPYAVHDPDKPYSFFTVLPKNVSELKEFMCGWMNRTGVLCSQCKKGLSLATLSYERKCVKCSSRVRDVSLFLFLVFIPSTIFFFIVTLCNINLSSGLFNATLTVIQISVSGINETPSYGIFKSVDPLTSNPTLLLMTIYGIWNLDFFRYVIPPFCISPSLTSLQALALEYVIAIYPLVLILVAYICVKLYDDRNFFFGVVWMPFKKFSGHLSKDYNIKNSLLITFGTFLQLAFSRFFFISKYFLHPAVMYNSSLKFKTKILHLDASVVFLSRSHIPYVALAVAMLTVFNMLPLILMLFYPTRIFHKILEYFPCINWHPLHAFMDIFQGCYKNGTNGTRNYRHFAAFNLLFRIVMVLPLTLSYFPAIKVLLPLVFGYMHGAFRPYRRDIYNNWDSFVFMLYGIEQAFVLTGIYSGKLSYIISCIFHSIFLSYFLLLCILKIENIIAPDGLTRIVQKVKIYRNSISISSLTTRCLRKTGTHIRMDDDDHTSPVIRRSREALLKVSNLDEIPTYGLNNDR